MILSMLKSLENNMPTFKNFVQAVTIFSEYCENGMNQQYMFGANHDEIYVYVSQDDLSPESEDGKKLQELGFEPHDGGNWACRV